MRLHFLGSARMQVMISITRFTEGNMGKHTKNTVAKLGLHLVSCPLRTGVKLCKKFDRIFNDEVKLVNLIKRI